MLGAVTFPRPERVSGLPTVGGHTLTLHRYMESKSLTVQRKDPIEFQVMDIDVRCRSGMHGTLSVDLSRMERRSSSMAQTATRGCLTYTGRPEVIARMS